MVSHNTDQYFVLSRRSPFGGVRKPDANSHDFACSQISVLEFNRNSRSPAHRALSKSSIGIPVEGGNSAQPYKYIIQQ